MILINNDGGGIFSFLPQAAHPEHFENFGTPTGLSFRPGYSNVWGNISTHRNLGRVPQVLQMWH